MATWVIDFAIPQIGWTFQEIFETTLLHRFVLLDQLLKKTGEQWKNLVV